MAGILSWLLPGGGYFYLGQTRRGGIACTRRQHRHHRCHRRFLPGGAGPPGAGRLPGPAAGRVRHLRKPPGSTGIGGGGGRRPELHAGRMRREYRSPSGCHRQWTVAAAGTRSGGRAARLTTGGKACRPRRPASRPGPPTGGARCPRGELDSLAVPTPFPQESADIACPRLIFLLSLDLSDPEQSLSTP